LFIFYFSISYSKLSKVQKNPLTQASTETHEKHPSKQNNLPLNTKHTPNEKLSKSLQHNSRAKDVTIVSSSPCKRRISESVSASPSKRKCPSSLPATSVPSITQTITNQKVTRVKQEQTSTSLSCSSDYDEQVNHLAKSGINLSGTCSSDDYEQVNHLAKSGINSSESSSTEDEQTKCESGSEINQSKMKRAKSKPIDKKITKKSTPVNPKSTRKVIKLLIYLSEFNEIRR